MTLTLHQIKAVKHLTGNLQLVACAGSGKTEVVAQQITNLLSPRELGGGALLPSNIIAFTFTEKAAAELKERVWDRCRAALPDLVGMAEMYVGTIHGFCLEFLRNEVPNYAKYDVLNEIQQILFVNRNSRKSGLTQTIALDKQPLKRYRDTSLYISILNILREAEINKEVLDGTSPGDALIAYRELLDEKAYLDYSSIIECAVMVLEKDRNLRERVAKRIKILIVDEYQDVNPIQERLIRVLQKTGAHVKVVGDDDQTIYQWRGSDAQSIIEFSQRYKPVSTIRMEDNFHSTEGIVDVARLSIEKNRVRLKKRMRPSSAQVHEAGDITALQFDNINEEASYIADTCKALLGTFIKEGSKERAISWSDMAVLVRMTASSEPIRQMLRSQNIPCVSVGMNSLFDAPEAEASRQLFYMMVNRATKKEVLAAWEKADLGVKRSDLLKALAEAEQTRKKMEVEDQEVRFSIYNIQRQFMGFLERIVLREETVPNDRHEVVFYNLGKFSQAISDFETINFHSAPLRKYESFADFLQFQAESAYAEEITLKRNLSALMLCKY